MRRRKLRIAYYAVDMVGEVSFRQPFPEIGGKQPNLLRIVRSKCRRV